MLTPITIHRRTRRGTRKRQGKQVRSIPFFICPAAAFPSERRGFPHKAKFLENISKMHNYTPSQENSTREFTTPLCPQSFSSSQLDSLFAAFTACPIHPAGVCPARALLATSLVQGWTSPEWPAPMTWKEQAMLRMRTGSAPLAQRAVKVGELRTPVVPHRTSSRRCWTCSRKHNQFLLPLAR